MPSLRRQGRRRIRQSRGASRDRQRRRGRLPALEKAGVARFLVSRPIFGGEGNEVVSLRTLRNLAEIDGGPVLTKALGETEALAVNARAAPLVRSSSTRIVMVRTDLTCSTAGPPAN